MLLAALLYATCMSITHPGTSQLSIYWIIVPALIAFHTHFLLRQYLFERIEILDDLVSYYRSRSKLPTVQCNISEITAMTTSFNWGFQSRLTLIKTKQGDIPYSGWISNDKPTSFSPRTVLSMLRPDITCDHYWFD